MLTSCISNEVLTDILPYGPARDGIIIFHIVTGDRPPRPQNDRWLTDQLWNMIETCWNEERELRWDIRAVHHQLSASSQWIVEGEQGKEHTPQAVLATLTEEVIPVSEAHKAAPNLSPVENPRQNTRGEGLSNFVEGKCGACRRRATLITSNHISCRQWHPRLQRSIKSPHSIEKVAKVPHEFSGFGSGGQYF